MAKIVILGAGVMGSAFGQMLVDAGHDGSLIGTHLDHEWIEGIRTNGVHPKLQVTLPDRIVPLTYDQFGAALEHHTDLIVLGVNSDGVGWAVEQLAHHVTHPLPIIMVTKGLASHNGALQILPTFVRNALADYGLLNVPVSAVAGPCIAGELAARRDSSVVITHPDAQHLDWLLELFTTPYYHARPSTDMIGVEACAALKNFYTLAIGYPQGLLEKGGQTENNASMHNLAAGLFTQALLEMCYLIEYMGGSASSVYDLPGAGDLYVTSQAGRNSRMGRLLGTGLCYRDAKTNHMAQETIEGAELALTIGPTIEQLLQQKQLEAEQLPLTAAIIRAICHNVPLQMPWTMFYRK